MNVSGMVKVAVHQGLTLWFQHWCFLRCSFLGFEVLVGCLILGNAILVIYNSINISIFINIDDLYIYW